MATKKKSRSSKDSIEKIREYAKNNDEVTIKDVMELLGVKHTWATILLHRANVSTTKPSDRKKKNFIERFDEWESSKHAMRELGVSESYITTWLMDLGFEGAYLRRRYLQRKYEEFAERYGDLPFRSISQFAKAAGVSWGFARDVIRATGKPVIERPKPKPKKKRKPKKRGPKPGTIRKPETGKRTVDEALKDAKDSVKKTAGWQVW